MHKNLVGSKFIIALPNHIPKPLLKNITTIFKLIYEKN